MKISRYISLAAAAVIAAMPLASCSGKGSGGVSIKEVEETSGQPTTHPVPSETYPDFPVNYPDIEKTDIGILYEAEKADKRGPLSVEHDKMNYSGEGYVTGFDEDGSSSVTFNVESPSNQHYDVSFNIAADKPVKCRIELNGNTVTSFKTSSDGQFTEITLYGVFLTKGKSQIEVIPEDGNICLDYLKLIDSDRLGEISYDANIELSNKQAGESAKLLMDLLTENYGKYMMTGQYAADNDNSELDLIYSITGKYPVIRFTNFSVDKGSFDESFARIEACADWCRNGGISGVSWYWASPSNVSSIKADESDFDLSKAVTDTDIAMLSQEEIRGLYGEGNISEQTYSLILDIDSMAGQLTSLKNKGIAVLWRPLPEGSGDWYWWGASGPEAYKWLWNLMYKRMTDYFELDNLIWIWNGQSESTLVDSSTYDIAAVDLYVSGARDYGDRFYEHFGGLQNTVGKDKFIAISECGSVPDVDTSFRDNSVWSFFVLWSGEYIENTKGEYSDKYTSRQSLIRLYNSTGALTLDEFKEMRLSKMNGGQAALAADVTEETSAEETTAETEESSDE